MNESGAEGIAGADGICNRDLGALAVTYSSPSRQRAAICAAGHAYSLKVEDQ